MTYLKHFKLRIYLQLFTRPIYAGLLLLSAFKIEGFRLLHLIPKLQLLNRFR
jgi:hypothetical protein